MSITEITSPTTEPAPAIHFDFAFEPAFRVLDAPFTVVPSRTGVTVDDERLTAHFGPWTVSTPLANVLAAEVTGPYRLHRVIGGPRLSLGDRGLTFATTTQAGVEIRFLEPVVGVDPTGFVRHPNLTVTVAEPAALAELLSVASARHGAAQPGDDGTIPVEELVADEHDDLLGLSAAELRRRARDLGLDGVAKLRKAELIELLQAPSPTDEG
jgi:hypothetical protein